MVRIRGKADGMTSSINQITERERERERERGGVVKRKGNMGEQEEDRGKRGRERH